MHLPLATTSASVLDHLDALILMCTSFLGVAVPLLSRVLAKYFPSGLTDSQKVELADQTAMLKDIKLEQTRQGVVQQQHGEDINHLHECMESVKGQVATDLGARR